jgi:hypothetical protein
MGVPNKVPYHVNHPWKHKDHARDKTVSRRIPTKETVTPRVIHVGFVVHEVALGWGFLRLLWFTPVSTIALIFIYYRRHINFATDGADK